MKILSIFLLLTVAGPLWLFLSGKVELHADWRHANRSSAHIAPDPKVVHEAVIQVYSARAFNWRGLFATHTWLAIKEENATRFIVCQIIGWRIYSGLSPLEMEYDIPDRYWFNQKPKIVFDLRGEKAKKLIPQILATVKSYPYSKYELWPGPNSNTLPAYIARKVPELQMALPADAIGKDFFPPLTFLARAASGTGYQFSIMGLFGITLAKIEGIEINILGFVYGISPHQRALKLPGIGDIQF